MSTTGAPIRRHVLTPPGRRETHPEWVRGGALPRGGATRRGAGGYDYPVGSPVATTPHVRVLVATSLGAPGTALGKAVGQVVEQDYQTLSMMWGMRTIGQVTVVIAPLSPGSDGSGGAYHYGCSDPTLYVDADTLTGGADVTAALYVAELVEVYEAAGGTGWDCGASAGEGLSRVLAEALHPGALDPYSTAAAWLDGDRVDWVSTSEPTDQDPAANGCSVLFLWWLQAVRGISAQKIAQAPGSTLAACYQAVTGAASAWQDFSAAVQAQWPAGQPSGVTSDNPWPTSPTPPPPPPPPQPQPGPTPQPGPQPGPAPILCGYLGQLIAAAQGHHLLLAILTELATLLGCQPSVTPARADPGRHSGGGR